MIDIESLRPALAEVERFVTWFNKDMGVRAKVVPVISKQYRKNQTACFAQSAWTSREGEEIHEIMLAAEQLRRDPTEILASVAHEMIHLFAHARGIKDCANSGRHNKKFQELAKDYGLECEKLEGHGYAQTSFSDQLKKRVEEQFRPDVEAFNLFRQVLPPKMKKGKSQLWICGCSPVVKIRSGKDIDVKCNVCNKDFKKDE